MRSPPFIRWGDWRKYPKGIFTGAGLLAYVIIPGLLVIWDRVLDYMGGY